MSTARPIMTMGEIMAAFITPTERPLDAATNFELHFAGAESNVAVGLARLGTPAAFVGRVGADALGRAALRYLRGENVAVGDVLVDEERGTGVLVRNGSASQSLEVVYARRGSAGSRICPDDVPVHSLEAAKGLHLTGITPMLSDSAQAAALLAAQIAQRGQVLVSFDPNHRWRLGSADAARTAMRPLLPYADLVLGSVEEILMLAKRDDLRQAEHWLLDQGVETLVVKDGANGATATDGHRRWTQPILPVPVVDPVGAGDAFNAGFLAEFRNTGDVGTSLLRGAELGAASVRSLGDTSGLPTAGAFPNDTTAGAVLR